MKFELDRRTHAYIGHTNSMWGINFEKSYKISRGLSAFLTCHLLTYSTRRVEWYMTRSESRVTGSSTLLVSVNAFCEYTPSVVLSFALRKEAAGTLDAHRPVRHGKEENVKQRGKRACVCVCVSAEKKWSKKVAWQRTATTTSMMQVRANGKKVTCNRDSVDDVIYRSCWN